MATKKDLVEAHSFSRRRLVTAFVSGAPGGREVEPSRPGRTIIGGLALAVLLCAGAAVAGFFKQDVDVDWEQPGLILSEEKGAAFVILEPDEDGAHQVRPVINVTSAQLILGENATPEVVPQAEIDEENLGPDIGILGAPVTVPDTDDLIESGWTACTDDERGIRFSVSTRPEVDPARGSGLLVKNGPTYYVIAHSAPADDAPTRAYRYELPKLAGLDNLLRDVGLPITQSATAVPAEWLDLFPAGGALKLESFGLGRIGKDSPQAGSGGLPRDAKVGDYYEIDGVLTVLTKDGPAELSDFARAVYLQLRPDAADDLGLTEPADVQQADPPYDDAHWPAGVMSQVIGEQCAQLLAEPGELPRAFLVENPGEQASAAEVEAGEREVTVEPGHGAFVLSGGWQSPEVGEPFVMDAKGFSYALIGTDAVENLGFGDYEAPVVPDSWLHLFEEGEELSVDAALCPPVRPSQGDGPGDGAGDGQGDSCE